MTYGQVYSLLLVLLFSTTSRSTISFYVVYLLDEYSLSLKFFLSMCVYKKIYMYIYYSIYPIHIQNYS